MAVAIAVAGGQIARVPEPAVAAVVISALLHALDPRPLVRLWRLDKDQYVAAVAVVGVMILGVVDGMFVAVASGVAFVAAEVVQDDDIARHEDRGENLLDVKEEGFAVDRPVDDPRRINPVVAQRGDEGQGLPMAAGRIGFSRRPLVPQPRRGAILVFTQVSSMNTSCEGAIRP
jgi:MFS superfamily sulfate permease-like transporter